MAVNVAALMKPRNVQSRISPPLAAVSLYTTGNILHARRPFHALESESENASTLQWAACHTGRPSAVPIYERETNNGVVSWFLE
jgi:hypothetical protein